MGPTAIPGASQPSQQSSTASQGVDIISQLIASAHEADARAAASAKQAIIPMGGGHVAPTQQKGFGNQNPILHPMDNSPVYGHHQATMRGIRNLTAGVANLVTKVDQEEAKKQQQNLQVNMERLLHGTASMDQAKEVLAQDPNNADAKKQFEQAQASISEILSDKKVRNEISKGFNINFTDPSKNNTKEHAAVKAATESYKEQFLKQLPTQMQPNQAAIAQATSDAADAKATHSLIDKLAPAIVTAQSREQSAAITGQSRIDTANIAAGSKVESAKIGYQRGVDAARIAGHFHLAAALATAKNRLDLLNKKWEHATGKGLDQMSAKEINEYIKDLNQEQQRLPAVISNLEQLRSDKGAKKANRTGVYDESIHAAEDEMDSLNSQITRAKKALETKGGFDGGGPKSQSDSSPTTTSGSTTNVRTATIPGADSFDTGEDDSDDDD